MRKEARRESAPIKEYRVYLSIKLLIILHNSIINKQKYSDALLG